MKLFGFGKKAGAKEADKKEPREKKRWLRMPRWVVIVLAVFLLLGGGATALNQFYVRPPDITATLPPTKQTIDPEAGALDPSMWPDVSPTPEDIGSPGLALDFGRKEGVYTIILAGTDFKDFNTDVLMVAALDIKNGTLKVLNIPRDAQIKAGKSVRKINAAWGVGGIDELKTDLKKIIGFEPESYAVVDLNGFVRLVNAIDGVQFDVPQDMKKTDPSQNLYINLKKGPQLLHGEEAIQLVRFRSYTMGDIQRIKVQQDFLKAVAKKTLQLGNLFKIGEFVDIAHDHLRSNLDVGQMLWFGNQMMKLESENITFYTLPVDIGAHYKDIDYALVRKDEAVALINETINPYIKDILADDLEIARVRDN